MPLIRVVRRFATVPDTWEGWAMRVLTVAVVVVLIAAFTLMGQVSELSQQISDGRRERIAFQEDQIDRLCVVLRNLHAPPADLKEAQC